MSTDMNIINWPGWETVGLIGRGSFGAVYEIQRDVFGDIEKAALKVISIPQNASDIDEMYSDGYDDESITSTFQSHLKSIVAEYSLMRKMNGSANIVNCDDIRYVQHDDGIGWDIFIKMELLTPLTKAFPADIPEDTVVKIAKDMCTALELCKKHEIVHRDIKPQNIFVSPNGDYKLGDFGIAKTVEKTMGGTKIGTYKYMAPEVYNNQPYGTAADIYSLGLVLYWMLNERRMPFLPLPPEKLKAGMDESARNRRLSGETLPPPAHGSKALKKIVLKACAYDPCKRYSSAADMLRALNESFINEEIYFKKEPKEKVREEAAKPAPTANPGLASKPVESRPKTLEERQMDLLRWKAEEETERLRQEQEKQERERKIQEEKEHGNKQAEEHASRQAGFRKKWLLLLLIPVLLIVWLMCNGPKKIPEETLKQPEAPSASATVTGDKSSTTTESESAAQKYSDENDTLPEPVAEGESKARIVAIAAGGFHTVVLREDGTVSAIGDNSCGQCNVSSWSDIVAIYAGDLHTIGVQSDGTIVATGLNDRGQCQVYDWEDIVAIEASQFHTVGVKSNGTVVAVGSNHNGGCDVSAWTDIIMADTTQTGTIGLRADGSVVTTKYECLNWQGITKIAAGDHLAIGLKADGTVFVGDPWDGNSNVSDDELALFNDIIDVDAGYMYVFGLKSDGTVVAAHIEDESFGQYESWCAQTSISEWNDICMIAAGNHHIVGLTNDGIVVAAGYNRFDHGQYDIGELN